jgi:pSer/pThr/pTyr-binding forkhead associated (FHA) protein
MAGVTCRRCDYENDLRQTTCQNCGAPMPRQRRAPSPSASPVSPPAAPAADGDPFGAAPAITVRIGSRDISLGHGDRLVVGRTPDSPVAALCGDNVSYRHAEIYVAGDAAYIVDTNSMNGTFVDGDRLAAGQPFALRSTVSVRLANDPPLVMTVEVRDAG